MFVLRFFPDYSEVFPVVYTATPDRATGPMRFGSAICPSGLSAVLMPVIFMFPTLP